MEESFEGQTMLTNTLEEAQVEEDEPAAGGKGVY